jgi:hypothetical protein
MKKRLIVGVFVLLLSLNLICASYSVGNSSHQFSEIYSLGGILTGWINMSFSSEPGELLFEDAIGGEVSLIELLKSNSGLDYSCSTLSCSPDYSSNNPETTKTIPMSEGETEIIGVVLTGDITKINSMEFNFASNPEESCSPQFKVNLFEGRYNLTNNNFTEKTCISTRNFGCYLPEETQENIPIYNTEYCQKVNLSQSPAFRLGALITPGDLSDEITFYLKTLDLEELETCSNDSFSSGEQYISCKIDYFNAEEGEYYVCVDSRSDSTHTLKGYSTPEGEGCGVYGSSETDESYAIYSEGYEFGKVSSMFLEDDFPGGGETFSDMIKDYIGEKYASTSNCEGGCVIPIEIEPMQDQNIVFSGLSLNYEKPSPRIESNFYDIVSSEAKITSDYILINLDNSGLVVDDEIGDYEFVLSFSGDEIISETLEILDIPSPKNIYPKKTISAYNTEFTVSVKPDTNISQTIWVFDSNTTKTSSTKKVTYAFSTLGNHSVNVTVVDNGGRRTSKVFNISVESPKKFIEDKIEENKENYEKISSKMENYSFFVQTILQSSLNLTGMNEMLKDLETSLSKAASNSDYNSLMAILETINIPTNLEETLKIENIPYSPTKEKIDDDIIMAISGEEITLK